MKILVMYRKDNMDSRVCLSLLEKVYGKAQLTAININYNRFIKPESKDFDLTFVVGINLNDNNKLFLDGLCKEVFYFEQSDEKASVLQLLKHLNLEGMGETALKRYQLIDAYQRGIRPEFFPESVDYLQCGLRYYLEYETTFDKVFTDDKIYDHVMQSGLIIHKSEETVLKTLCDRLVRSIQFNGRPCLIANHTGGDIFKFIPNLENYGMCIAYSRNKSGKINVRLTTVHPDVDVRVIAKEYNGGGPSSSIAGFNCLHLPKEILFQIHGVDAPDTSKGS